MTRLVLVVLAAGVRGTQHMETPGTEGMLKDQVASVSASTTMPDWKSYTFGAKNLLDDDRTTSWQPKKNKTGGAGEWVQVDLKTECTIDGLEVANGLQMDDKLGNLFHKNNRVNEARLKFSDGSEQMIELDPNEFGWVRFKLTPAKTKFVKLEVVSVHKGTQWNDLAISELKLLGSCAK